MNAYINYVYERIKNIMKIKILNLRFMIYNMQVLCPAGGHTRQGVSRSRCVAGSMLIATRAFY